MVTATHTFYRITQSATPTLRDFFSAKALAELAAQAGRPPRKPPTAPERLAVWDGVSVYDSEDGARKTALFYQRRIGGFIARLRLAEGGPITYRKTLGAGHYTLWGEPAAMLERVELVAAVQPTATADEMIMDYELYDLESANLVAGPLTEARALALVRQALEEDGPEVVELWALGRIDHTGTPIMGRDLIDRALKAAA